LLSRREVCRQRAKQTIPLNQVENLDLPP